MRRRLALALLGCAALVAAGCESTFSKADKLAVVNAKEIAANQPKGFQLGDVNANVKGNLAQVITSEDGTIALVLAIGNTSATGGAVWVPMRIELLDAAGKVIGTNTEAGTSPLLNHLPSIGPKSRLLLVSDQLTADGDVKSARITVGGGAAKPLGGGLPELTVKGLAIDTSDPFGLAFKGTVTNNSDVAQPAVLVSVTAAKGEKYAAAGSSVVSDLGAGTSQDFSGYWIGNPKGAKLAASAPATSTPTIPGSADDTELKTGVDAGG